jgi:Phosphoenolpyruvate phosphomutase
MIVGVANGYSLVDPPEILRFSRLIEASDRQIPPMSVTQTEKAAHFRALHAGPDAFIIPNPWDVGSARILAGLGFQALATSRAASASALGRRDHMLTRDESPAHVRLIVDATNLPTTGRHATPQ